MSASSLTHMSTSSHSSANATTAASAARCCVHQESCCILCNLDAAAAKVFNQNGTNYHVTFGILLGFVKSQDGSVVAKGGGGGGGGGRGT